MINKKKQELNPFSLTFLFLHIMKIEMACKNSIEAKQPMGFAQCLEMHVSLKALPVME